MLPTESYDTADDASPRVSIATTTSLDATPPPPPPSLPSPLVTAAPVVSAARGAPVACELKSKCDADRDDDDDEANALDAAAATGE